MKTNVKDWINYDEGTIGLLGKADIESPIYEINELMVLSAQIRSAINKFKTVSELTVSLFNKGSRIEIQCNGNLETFNKFKDYLRNTFKDEGLVGVDFFRSNNIDREILVPYKANLTPK